MNGTLVFSWISPAFIAFGFLSVAVLGVALSGILKSRWKRTNGGTMSEKVLALDPYKSITALEGFNWKTKAPLALRPFKPIYHLTMGLETVTLDELIEVDNTYATRIELRRQILNDHPSTMSVRACGVDAVSEFYTWMTTVYLPSRFPSMYQVEQGEKAAHLLNRTTGEALPLQPESVDEALKTLGGHVDTDFLFLLPSADDGKYLLTAYVTTFPSGFSTLEKLGQSLAAIHKPVPGYAAKLEKSMDRFFANLPLGKIVKRANWSVTTNDILYAEHGTHLYAGDEEEGGSGEVTVEDNGRRLEEEIARQKAKVNIQDCRLRCERQTLHRLPTSKALVFAFKTYQYTLAEIKAEGTGEALADAIEGLGQGSVPEMKVYKRGVVWGEKVVEYLRS